MPADSGQPGVSRPNVLWEGRRQTLLGEGQVRGGRADGLQRELPEALFGSPGSDATGTCVSSGTGEEQQKQSMSEYTEEVIFPLIFKHTLDC